MTVRLAAPTLALDLTFKQGAGATVTLTVVDKDGKPYDVVTNLAVRAQIRVGSSGTVLFEWNTTGTPGPALGAATVTYSPTTLTSVVTLPITGAQTALFTFPAAQWDCFFTASGTEPVCLAAGSVTVIPWITH